MLEVDAGGNFILPWKFERVTLIQRGTDGRDHYVVHLRNPGSTKTFCKIETGHGRVVFAVSSNEPCEECQAERATLEKRWAAWTGGRMKVTDSIGVGRSE